MRCTITRLADSLNTDDDDDEQQQSTTVDEHGRSVITQCFEVPFTILDVDECTVPNSNPMAHKCQSPSTCINTPGSYECLCPSESSILQTNAAIDDTFWHHLANDQRSAWELSLASSGQSSCPDLPSTHTCCDDDGHSHEGAACRATFACAVDPCAEGEAACAPNAGCERASHPLAHPKYSCVCPAGLMGNGHGCRGGRRNGSAQPKVKYDGVTPTEDTRRALEEGLIWGVWSLWWMPVRDFQSVLVSGKRVCVYG